MVSNNEPNYIINCFGGEFLLNFKIDENDGIASGIGIYNFSGNGFNSIGNFYHKRSLLKIPLLYNFNSNISSNIKINMNIGVYVQAIITDEYRFINNTQEYIYKGCSFGSQIGLGFLYSIFDKYNIGLNFNTQTDFSKFKTVNSAIIIDKQKIKFLNSVGIILVIYI